MVSGRVIDIHRFSLDDGPGIRTVVFMKGCPLRCMWCCNPESWEMTSSLMYRHDKCLECGSCIQVCPAEAISNTENGISINRMLCENCGRCASECPSMAIELSGKTMSAEQVYDIVEKDYPYYVNSGGGITFSGGEALLQADFVLEVLGLCKRKSIHTCVETSGAVKRELLESAIPLTDMFLYDFKHYDSEAHKRYCGMGNELILSNLKFLSHSENVSIILRCPIIPGVNDNKDHFSAIVDISEGNDAIIGVQIMPYHNYGADKYIQLGMSYPIPKIQPVSAEQKRVWAECLMDMGCRKLM